MGAEEPGLSRKQFTCRGHVFEIWGDGYFRVRVCLEELPLLEPGRGEGGEAPQASRARRRLAVSLVPPSFSTFPRAVPQSLPPPPRTLGPSRFSGKARFSH